ncbi:MAG: family 10 glycosylhydrolase [Phocaeicola sp.]|nr:family 10 glycosylhydrolase [Phocaeicola sp.]MDD7449108.1 family 10 glycosylhydrolase [Prevotellaceae bacterium]MDY3913508.1 family 10 glycosylhydrolase [Phocaeicola sp.]MDY5939504.1 family 10 glycosylhydrolase [Phocaeicola sp.]
MKKLILILVACLCTMAGTAQNMHPKREFRGAWIQCVNGQFQGKTTAEIQKMLISQLDVLEEAGINAIIFQVRPEADALYNSPYEPWSRFLTGEQGKAPVPYWDPLQFMIDECHKRNMELHAWVNPYRAKTKGTTRLSTMHPHYRHPEMFFTYADQMYFDPGLPSSRKYICMIVEDIVKRYDVDAIHMDDYFYPYPVPGLTIPDDKSFAAYGRGFSNKGDWRRDNVNVLIKELHETIRSTKPWVKFGISPFGIYRNEKSVAYGSKTNGLQNYDDLYADVLLWVNNGWIDYNIPQIYWEIGHPAADYNTLVRWWAKHASARPLYIGQDVIRTVTASDSRDPYTNQMPAKYNLQRSLPQVQGSAQWYASAVIENKGNYKDLLQQYYHRYPSLQPAAPFIDNKPPKRVRKLKAVWTEDGYMLFWTPSKGKKEMDKSIAYVVYRFAENEGVNLNNTKRIVTITRNTFVKLDYQFGNTRYRYVVTALDRLQNESKGKDKLVKL